MHNKEFTDYDESFIRATARTTRSLVYAEASFGILKLPALLQLMDDGIELLIALTMIVNRQCRSDCNRFKPLRTL